MRYVTLVVAIGLLVVGIGAYTAKAAQGKAARDGRLYDGVGIADTIRLTAAQPVAGYAAARDQNIVRKQQEALKAQQEAVRAQQEAARQEEERRSAEALELYGAWGPDLVRAAAMYGQDPAELYRVMLCESGGDPYADNGVCKGLFQFDPRTWAGTPFAGFSIYDGQAQIYATAWMFSQGRQYEWTCY